jgi:hypothetical protein
MDDMQIVFICGPYRAKTLNGIVENIRIAEKYAKKYWELGYCVICPHKNTSLLDGFLPDDIWLKGAQKLLSVSDIVVVLPGWLNSSGSVLEHKLARRLNKKIIFEGDCYGFL